jgi:hypothetical protein
MEKGTGTKIVLPNEFADEIKSNPDLSFNEAFSPDLFADYPGFEAFKAGLKDDSYGKKTFLPSETLLTLLPYPLLVGLSRKSSE